MYHYPLRGTHQYLPILRMHMPKSAPTAKSILPAYLSNANDKKPAGDLPNTLLLGYSSTQRSCSPSQCRDPPSIRSHTSQLSSCFLLPPHVGTLAASF